MRFRPLRGGLTLPLAPLFFRHILAPNELSRPCTHKEKARCDHLADSPCPTLASGRGRGVPRARRHVKLRASQSRRWRKLGTS